MFKYSKLALKIYIFAIILPIAYFVISAYISDPLKIYHKSFFEKTQIYGPTRESLKAIIRDNDFDSIVIGSSLSQNYSAKEVSNKLNANYINISFGGGICPENALFIKYAIKKKKIKNVFYIFDTSDYVQLLEKSVNYDIKSYDFLYDSNPFAWLKIYTTSKYLPCVLTFSKNSSCIGKARDMDKPYAWDSETKAMSIFGGFDKWIAHSDSHLIKEDFSKIKKYNKIIDYTIESDYLQKAEAYFDKYFFSIAKENPDVHFDILLSPCSNLQLALLLRTDDIKNGHLLHFIEGQKLFIKKAQAYPNITVYGFQNDDINEIENYKDLIHFHPDINKYMLDKVDKKQNILTVENMDGYFDKVKNTAYKQNYNFYRNKILNSEKGKINEIK